MRTSEFPEGVPHASDVIAWSVGALSTAERIATPPNPESPPPIGLTKFDGSSLQWMDLNDESCNAGRTEAVEVSSEEPVTDPEQAGDAYVAQRNK